MMKIPKPPGEVTLADFKAQLNRPAAKFFFKSKDEEVGIVKEEVTDDTAILPLYSGRIVSWLVSGDSTGSDKASDRLRKTPDFDESDLTTLASGYTNASGVSRQQRQKKRHHRHHKPRHIDSVSQYGDQTDTGTELESMFDESEMTSMASYSTMTSIASMRKDRRRVFTKTRPTLPRGYSSTTIAESTISESMQIITVILKMETVNFLGISIMGQAGEEGAGGIFVGSIMRGGAVAADGRVKPGDLILKVNEVEFANLNNEEAVKVLREVVQQSGPITLVVARPTYDPVEELGFNARDEPIQPMDPALWVQQTQGRQALQFGGYPHGRSPTMSTMTSDSGSQATSNSMPESERDLITKLTLATPIHLVARTMAGPNSGLERKDHKWLKMVIPNSFLGSTAVDWLFSHVEGFIDRRHSKRYASLMLKDGYIKHTVNKISFSEQCYYVFGDVYATTKPQYKDLQKELSKLSTTTGSSESGGDGDTIGPLPPIVPWASDERLTTFSDRKGHRSATPDSASSSASSSGGQRTVGGASKGVKNHIRRHGSIISEASTNFTSVSQQCPGGDRGMPDMEKATGGQNNLAQMRDMSASASRVSFQAALEGNPCEYFIDYM